ncbi:MAG: LysE family translocator [Actinomycetota bacterium]
MELSNWFIYFLAALGLTLTPGPNGLLALTHGALYGTRKTIATILGGSVGFATVIGLSMFGIGALLQASAQLLIVMKFLGGAYLIWLGIQLWRSPSLGEAKVDKSKSSSSLNLFSQGALSAITNPKGILFFVAFLPQFIDPNLNLLTQFIVMALTFVAIEFVYEFVVAALANRIQPALAKFGKKVNRIFGGVFILIGVALPLRG